MTSRRGFPHAPEPEDLPQVMVKNSPCADPRTSREVDGPKRRISSGVAGAVRIQLAFSFRPRGRDRTVDGALRRVGGHVVFSYFR